MRMRCGIAVAFCAITLISLGAGTAGAEVITNSSESLRTGWYPGESAISPESVSSGSFGEEWSASVEGSVYGQPLLDGSSLLIATEHNVAYALNPETGAARWSTVLQGTPWNPAENDGYPTCTDLTPEVGVTSTPVIDSSTNTEYLTHKAYRSGSGGEVVWWMDALNVENGEERPGFPVEIHGTAQNDSGASFEPRLQLQRPGLLLMEGVVYAGFGSDCDYDPYKGWVFGVGAYKAVHAAEITAAAGPPRPNSAVPGSGSRARASPPTGPARSCSAPATATRPNRGTAGNQPAGARSASRSCGFAYRATANCAATEFFAPSDAAETPRPGMRTSPPGGVTGLPNGYFGTSSIPHLAVAVGKDGYVYLLNRDNLGGIGRALGEARTRRRPLRPLRRRLGAARRVARRRRLGLHPDRIRRHHGGRLLRFPARLQIRPQRRGKPTLSLAASSGEAFGFGSGSPVITSNGTVTGSGLVWIEWAPGAGGEGAQLRAYNTAPAGGEPVLRKSWPIGTASKFAMPGVGGGRIFVGTRDGHVLAFGSPVPPPVSGSPTEFPATIIGHSSERTLTLTANEEVEIEKITTEPSSEFSNGAAAPYFMEAGEKVQVPITFSPKKPGLRAGTVTATVLARTGPPKIVQFSLNGVGEEAEAKLQLSPRIINFRGVTIGARPVSESATITNVGAGTLTLNKVEIAQSGSAFAGTLPKPETHVAPGESLQVPLTFEPSVPGAYSGELRVQWAGGTQATGLAGSGAARGHLQVSPASLGFGQVAVGSSKTESFVLSNTGGSTVHVYESLPPGGAFHGGAGIEEETTIEPGESISETVTFAPTATGPAGGAWSIVGNDPVGREGEEVEVLVGGEGVAASGPSGPSGPELRVLPFTASVGPDAKLAARAAGVSPTGALTLPVSCPTGENACVGTLSLHTLGLIHLRGSKHGQILTLGSASFAVAGGRVAAVRVHLSKVGRELFARHHPLKVRVSIVAHDSSGRKHSGSAILTLKPLVRRRG